MLPMLRSRVAMTSPFDALYDMRREVDRLLGDIGGTDTSGATAWSLPTEVLETGEEIRFITDIPGVHPEDLNVTVENGVLLVTGERKLEREEGQEGDFRLFERRYGRFERAFRVPQNVRTDSVKARYENGVLTVVLPKTEESRPRRIEIEPAGGTRRIESQQGS